MNQEKIARLTNTSIASVSKALSGSREISAELREKIIDTALETGYFTEVHKRKRDYNSNVVIAVICPEIISPYYAFIINHLKTEVESHGGKIAVYIDDFDENKVNDTVRTLTVRNQADGIILLSSCDILIRTGIPIIYFNSSPPQYPADSFSCNTDVMLSDAVRYLRDLGHTEIGFIGENYTANKFASFRKALSDNSLSYCDQYSVITESRFEKSGFDAAERLSERDEMPTAVIAAYDEIAMGFIRRMQKKNIRVPEDISVIGINDIPYSSYAQIPLTTIHAFSDEVYHTAVNVLYNRISGGSSDICRYTFEHRLIVRETTAKPREGQKNGKL